MLVGLICFILRLKFSPGIAVHLFQLIEVPANKYNRQKYSEKTVLVLYGGSKETHEAAFVVKAPGSVTEGSGVRYSYKNGVFTINWKVTPQRKIVKVGGLYVYLLGSYSSNIHVSMLTYTRPQRCLQLLGG